MQGRFGGPPPGAGATGRAGAPPAQGTAPTPAPAPTPPPAAPAGAPVVRPPSEDCLYLNVWRPADPATRNAPVMVWIYGGGFTGGSSSSPNTSGAQFAKQGVVLVAMNYRVGRFGFFAHPALSKERPDELKGNYAYMDQIAALQWVKRNIAAFGGNPNNVTIFGFSAGGVSVHSMLASPLARGLFHKAIAESGGSPGQRAHRPADARGRRRSELSGLGRNDRDHLREIDGGRGHRPGRAGQSARAQRPSRSFAAFRPRPEPLHPRRRRRFSTAS